jgi:hypothetical protein
MPLYFAAHRASFLEITLQQSSAYRIVPRHIDVNLRPVLRMFHHPIGLLGRLQNVILFKSVKERKA